LAVLPFFFWLGADKCPRLRGVAVTCRHPRLMTVALALAKARASARSSS
jgi:hypothetical protein